MANDRHSLAVALTTLGCKLNQAETEELTRRFLKAGFRVVDYDGIVDVYVINTCTVTHVADRKSRQLIRHARRANPSALVVATGCYVDVAPNEVVQVDQIDLVVANDDKPRIAELVNEALGNMTDARIPETELHIDPALRTRAFVKIEEGCNKFCTFCIVPVARGRERSVPIEEVVSSVARRVDAGHREIVLTGVHVGTYGKDLKGEPEIDLTDLVRALLERTGVERLRLSSIEPMDFHPGLLAIWENDRVCRHIHLPLQSGSDSVLRRMRRRYDPTSFVRTIERIRAAIPDVAITTDVIVGFPGETDAEFQETYDLAREIGFAGIHVFKYSPRRGTVAAKMPEQVPYQVKKTRGDAMMRLASQSAASFRRGYLGETLDVLFETQATTPHGHLWEGLTDNYVRVFAACEDDLTNQVCQTEILGEIDGSLLGRVLQKSDLSDQEKDDSQSS